MGALALQVESLEIPGVLVITPRQFGDERGFFSETYNKRVLAEQGIEGDFVQDNHSLSAVKGTIRGLHFQIPPRAQAKLVRVVRGAVFDVAVDLRKGSPTFGRHVSMVLSKENWSQMFVPVGFAHGFCTLEPDTEVLYKVTEYYSPEHDKGLLWNDPRLAVDWPVGPAEAMLSDRDRTLPGLDDMPDHFSYESAVNG
jgi:dTDP-4-dehydrorhamnose 3,5-epimerase